MRPIVIDGLVWSVSLSVTIVSPAKTAEPIETLYWVGQRNHALDGSSGPHGRGNFEGKGRPIVKYRKYRPHVAANIYRDSAPGPRWKLPAQDPLLCTA